MNESQLNYSIKEHDNVCVFIVNEKRVDSLKAPSFKTEILRLIASGWKNILINLENVEIIDSSGLGAFTFGKRQIGEIGGNLALHSPKHRVLSLFRIAKLDRVFDIYETQEEGLNKMQEQSNCEPRNFM